MNNLIVVSSSIQPRQGVFTYSKTRSIFSADDRFKHTIFTINSLRNCLPNSKIVIIDSSDDYIEYKQTFEIFKNVEFIPLKELSGEAFEIVNTHPNKSLCESLILNTYFTQYKKQIKEYDYLLKSCGRYFYFDLDDKYFTPENIDKIFFKSRLGFEWSDAWNYSFVDKRAEQNNNLIHQYSTILYGFGTSHLEKFIDINEATIHMLNQRQMIHYDIETLSYYLTRPYEKAIIETDWIVSGWEGISGRYMYY